VSSNISTSSSDHNKILPSDISKGSLSYPSYMTSLPLLSNRESFVTLPPLHHTDNNNKPKTLSSNEDDDSNSNNNNNHSVRVLPSTLLTEDKNEDEMSITSSSFDSFPEYKSENFLPSSKIKAHIEDKTELEPELESEFNKDLNSMSTISSKPIPTQNRHISYNLSQSFPKRSTYLNTNHHRHSSSSKNNINYLYPNRGVSASPDSFSLSSILENPESIALKEKVENSNNDSVLRQYRIRFKPQSLLSSNNKQNNSNQGNDNIRRRKTIYTSTSYFNKSNNSKNSNNKNKNKNININDQNNNNSKNNSNKTNNQNINQIINNRKSNSNDTNELRRAHSLHYNNRSSNGYRYSQSYGVNNRHDSISSSRSALTNFLSNFSFASSNSNTNTYSEQDEEEEDYDNEFADHSFIKSSASLYSSFINAEAEKKSSTDSKTPSVFDPDFIEKVRNKTIKHQKSLFFNSESYDKNYMEPSSFNSIIPEPEKLRLLNPVYVRAQYFESLRNHEDHQEPQLKSKSTTLSEMEQDIVSPDQILDTITAEKLRFHLPRRYREYSTWELIFSLSEHGSSFITLYDKIVGKGPLLMAIKDSNDQIFGAYISESVQISSRYYGTGECFLWKKGDGHDQRSFKVFEWSGLNELNILTTRDMIAFGGGKQGHFGLCLDQYLEGGTTARCDTFRNEPLTISSRIDDVIKPQTVPTYYETPDISFECINIEFWKIVDNLR
jgi:hypothetical protein